MKLVQLRKAEWECRQTQRECRPNQWEPALLLVQQCAQPSQQCAQVCTSNDRYITGLWPCVEATYRTVVPLVCGPLAGHCVPSLRVCQGGCVLRRLCAERLALRCIQNIGTQWAPPAEQAGKVGRRAGRRGRPTEQADGAGRRREPTELTDETGRQGQHSRSTAKVLCLFACASETHNSRVAQSARSLRCLLALLACLA